MQKGFRARQGLTQTQKTKQSLIRWENVSWAGNMRQWIMNGIKEKFTRQIKAWLKNSGQRVRLENLENLLGEY